MGFRNDQASYQRTIEVTAKSIRTFCNYSSLHMMNGCLVIGKILSKAQLSCNFSMSESLKREKGNANSGRYRRRDVWECHS